MPGGPSLRILHGVETLVPPQGGAERFTLEWMGALAERHDVRAVFLAPPGAAADTGGTPPGVTLNRVTEPPRADGYWADKRRRREAVGAAVRAALEDTGADVVTTALHAGPAVIEAAAGAGVPAVLFLPSYEALCKYAFQRGSACHPDSGCRECPDALALPAAEHDELLRSRAAHEHALSAAAALVAVSRTVADACERWCGRRPEVVPGSLVAPDPVQADQAGHVQLVAATWSPHKGLELLEPLADALAPRRVAITDTGLGAERVRRLGERPNVSLVPPHPVRQLLAGAAALLVPSQWPEPFGRLAFEGMASGVPTLAAAVGGMREFVPTEQLVDPPDDVTRWAAAVEALADPGRWDAARERGRAAATGVLAGRPLEQLEAVLLAAAGRPSEQARRAR